jgi:hypothetical protein
MTEAEMNRKIAAMERITNEALKSKESTWQLLIDAGIYTEEDKRKHEEKMAKKKNKK